MTDTPKSLLTTTALASSDLLRASMTAAERAHGRFMRAPDHGDGDQGGADSGEGDQSGADDKGGADDQGAADDKGDASGKDDAGADDKSLMNGDDKGEGDKDGAKEGDDADKDSKDGEKKDEPEGPPEKYELTAPEGFDIDEKLLAEADPIFREIGLTSAQANLLMPLVPKFAEALFGQQNDAFQAQASDWAKAAKADKEIGGKNWGETETLVAKALDQFAGPKGTPEKPNVFRDLLDNTKLGNHPEMIRMFRKIGAQLGEGGSLPRSDASAPVKLAREEVLYPDDVPKVKA